MSKYNEAKLHLASRNDYHYGTHGSLNNTSKDRYEKQYPSFTGLNRIMKHRIYESPEYFQKLLLAYKRENGHIGTLPKDIIEIIGGTDNPKIKDNIEYFKNCITSTNVILKEVEIEKIAIAKTLNIKNLINPFLPKLAKINIEPKRIPKTISEMLERFAPPKEYYDEMTSRAARYLEDSLKLKNLIPEDTKVAINYIGQGNYKNAYKLDFLDKDGKQLVHSKVILSFKNADTTDKQVKELLNLIKKYYQTMKLSEYTNNITNIITQASKKVVPPEKKETYINELLDLYKRMNSKNEEEKLSKLIKNAVQEKINYNGIGPESNITQFIKNSAGHPLKSSNFIEMHFFNWQNNIGLSEYSDNLLPGITKQVNLSKYGLWHDDLKNNKNNLVNNRIIDYGGIKRIKSENELTDNSIIRRYYHKFSQINYKDKEKTQLKRVEYWNDLYDRAKSHKISNHNNILKSLEKSKDFIEPEYLSKLHDYNVKNQSGLNTFKTSA